MASILLFRPRSQQFAVNPTVPLSTVAQRYGFRFNEYAMKLGLHHGSVLLPDIGGALYYSNLKVHDLGGLCDKRIAQNYARLEKIDLWQYVFDEIRPTFIHLHDSWTLNSQLQLDRRFSRDYLPIVENETPLIRTYNQQYHRHFRNGDYVRRDAIRGHEDAFQRLQAQYIDSEN